MNKIISRLLKIELPPKQSAFLWGPRKTGKTYWITKNFRNSVLIDLLKTDVFADYVSRPSLLRERYQDHSGLIVIDEIQMVPELLNEIHWMIENTAAAFFQCQSRQKLFPNSGRHFAWLQNPAMAKSNQSTSHRN